LPQIEGLKQKKSFNVALNEKIENLYGGNPKNFWNTDDSDLAGSQVSYERINIKNRSSNNSSNDLRIGDS